MLKHGRINLSLHVKLTRHVLLTALIPLFFYSILLDNSCMYSLAQVEEMPKMEMRRGINLGNALEAPREGEWGVYIKDEYFSIIRKAGFDTVRIPIRWSAHADQNPPYKIDDDFLMRVDWVVNKALEQGLIVVINIHHYEEIMQDPLKHRERFISLWRQIAEHYMDYPENLYFELLNEPSGSLTSEIWNELLADTIRIIRKTNPTRKIIVGPVDWNSIHRLKDLVIPEDDKNVIVTFHFYTPFEFTHQGAEWVNPSPPVGRKWLGTKAEKKQITDELDMAVQWSIRHGNITLFLGEFGAYSKADIGSRIRWTYFVAREAEKRNIAWCYWEFCAGFGVYDPIVGKWRDELLNALIPKEDMYYVSVITDYGDVIGSGWYYKGTYATVKLSKLRTGFLVLNVFDHFEGLKPEDRIVDERTVEVYVDEHREIHAVWRKDYSQLILLMIGVLIIMGVVIALLRGRHGAILFRKARMTLSFIHELRLFDRCNSCERY